MLDVSQRVDKLHTFFLATGEKVIHYSIREIHNNLQWWTVRSAIIVRRNIQYLQYFYQCVQNVLI